MPTTNKFGRGLSSKCPRPRNCTTYPDSLWAKDTRNSNNLFYKKINKRTPEGNERKKCNFMLYSSFFPLFSTMLKVLANLSIEGSSIRKPPMRGFFFYRSPTSQPSSSSNIRSIATSAHGALMQQ